GVAGLNLKFGPVDGAAVEARGRAGLQTASAQAEFLQRFTEQNGSRFAGTAGGVLLLAAVDESVEECPGSDDDSLCGDAAAVAEKDAGDAVDSRWSLVVGENGFLPSVGMTILIRICERLTTIDQRLFLHNHIRHFGLLDLEIGLRFEDFTHLQAIGLFVALGARRPDRWATRSIEQSKLDSDRVRDLAHDAAEGVHFADEVSFGDTTDRRVTRHLCDQIDVEGIESRLEARAGGGHRGLAPGMASANHYDVEMFVERLHLRSSKSPKARRETSRSIVAS